MLEEKIETMLTTRDGMNIFVRAWEADQPQRILICIQGLGGHGGYYEELAGQLAPEGIIVVAPDLRGHGQSKGQRGNIDRFDRYLLDIDAAVTWVMARWPHIPIFMLGESMGASLAIQYAANIVKSQQVSITPPILAGLVLVSPVLRSTIHPTIREAIQYIRSLLIDSTRPSLAVTGREELGCRDPLFNAFLQADPLFVRFVSAHFLTNLGLWLWRTRRKAHQLHLPLLVLQGGEDHIAHPRGTAAFLRHVASKEQQSVAFPQAYHCLLHDPDTPAVIKVLASWLRGKNFAMIGEPCTPKASVTSQTSQARKAAWLAFITTGCIVYFFLVVAILHVLRPDDNPVKQAVSNYAVGPYGFLMISAFFALALGMFTLALGLTGDIKLTRRAKAAMRLLYVASFGLVVVGIFPGDVNVPHPPATITGLIHWIAAGTSFLSMMIAALLLSYCFKENICWQSYHRPALVLTLTAVAALATFGMLVLIGWIGIGERIYITTSLLWPLLTAIRLWSHVTEKRIKDD